MFSRIKKMIPEKKYHVHGLMGFRSSSYGYIGAYQFEWMAKFACHLFVMAYPYGATTITNSSEKPEIKC